MAVNIGEMVTVSLRERSGELSDIVTNHNALLRRLDKKGNKKPVDGGREIVEELEYAENGTVKWYSDYEVLDTSPQRVFDAATFDWRQLSGNVTISGLEELKNAGKNRIINLIDKRMKNLEKSLRNTMATAIYNDGTDPKAVGGLRFLVADDPTTSSVVGGVNQNTYSWWRNETRTVSGSFSASNVTNAMNLLWLDICRGTDKPDFIVGDANSYNAYENSLQAIQRVGNADEADAGYMTLKYKGADVFYDDQCPTDHLYFLDTDYIYLRPHTQRQFVPLKRRESTNQDAFVQPVVWAGNLTCSNRGQQGVITVA